MILARIAIYGAIFSTLWFNGSYAYGKADGDTHQLAMVAVAVTIDLCKCGFLTAAAHLWAATYRVAPAVLVALWPLAFGYSLFAGYASIASNRSAATVTAEGDAEARARTKAEYEQATAALATAKTSPFWSATAACTAPKTAPHRQFCDGIALATQRRQKAAAILDASKPTHVDPELALLTAFTGLPASVVLLLAALVPALILELVASLGFYAINRPTAPKPTSSLQDAFPGSTAMEQQPQRKNPPEGQSEALATKAPPESRSLPAPPPPPRVWKISP